MWKCVVRAVWIGMVLGATLSSSVSADGNRVVAQIDLQRQTDFALARGLDLRPFFRLQNVFFALLSTTELKTLQNGGVSCRIIDDAPSDALDLVGPIESIVSRKAPPIDIERLTEVGDRAIYKSLRPIDRKSLRQSGFIPLESTTREKPLTWLAGDQSSTSANHFVLDHALELLVAEVNQDSLFSFVSRLEAFQTRYAMTDSNLAAREWIQQKFVEFGYEDISIQKFPDYNDDFGDGISANVICIKEGTVEPDKVVVIGAHFDTWSGDGLAAPGADDNGSGVAAVLECARILVDTPTKKTIIFAAFDAGIYRAVGARHYAEYLYDNGIDLEFMLDLDMIGYTNNAYDGVYFGYDLPSTSHLYFMGEMATRYSALYPEFTNDIQRTNNFTPFREYGYRATYVTEYGYNPGWYTAEDLTSAMDFAYLTEVTKMSLATVYGISEMPATIDDSEVGDIGDGHSLRVSWIPRADPDIIGYRIYYGTVSGRYSDTLFVGDYSTSAFILEGLDNGMQYYAAVIGVDLAGNESIARPEISGTPRRTPLPPSGVVA